MKDAIVSKARLATVWLDGCSGCHMSILDLDETLAVLADKVDLVYGPLVDAQQFPEKVDVTLVEGAVSNQADLRLLQVVRARSAVLVALGDCAVTGNVPSMRNGLPVKRLLERVYVQGSDAGESIPTEGVPPLMKHAIPLHEAVKVDAYLPGCPPKPVSIAETLLALLDGRRPELAGKVKFG